MAAYKQHAVESILERRQLMLASPMFPAAHALDPEFVGKGPISAPVMRGLIKMVDRLSPNATAAATTMAELEIYTKGLELFAEPSVMAAASKMNSVSWWEMYGGSAPNLQLIAMKVLSCTPSACSCERNWSNYGFIHNKKRNKLTAVRAKKLVSVFSSLQLQKATRQQGRRPRHAEWEDTYSSDEERGYNAISL